MSMTVISDEFSERRLERLERQYRRAQYILSGALAAYESLHALPDANDLQKQGAWQRVKRARDQLQDIQSTIEYVEDYESMYGSPNTNAV